MAEALVLGAGPVGLASAMLLAREGYTVTVLDPDPEPPSDDPAAVWAQWQRKGVAQFRQPHLLLPRGRHELEAELPQVIAWLKALGGHRLSFVDLLPRSLPDRSRQPGDERFETITARRPVLDAAFARAAQDSGGVDVLRGVSAVGPLSGASALDAVPHVAGVRTSTGQELRADLVVDAMGRRSKLAEWAVELGGAAPFEEASDAGFAYYTRHFSSVDGTLPEMRAPFGVDLATVRILTLPADNGCWTVAVIPMAGDAPFKALRGNEAWTRVVSAFPHAAHWLDGQPLTDVLPMAGVLDRRRRVVVDGRPVITGMLPVGDAWACTNPMAGRGISLGLAHAVALREAVRSEPDDPARLAVRFDELTESALTPWYVDQVQRDRQRAADISGTIEGRPPEPSPQRRAQAAFFAGVAADPEIARGWFDTFACLALPQEVLQRPGFADRLAGYDGAVAQPMPGPTREDLLAAMAAAA